MAEERVDKVESGEGHRTAESGRENIVEGAGAHAEAGERTGVDEQGQVGDQGDAADGALQLDGVNKRKSVPAEERIQSEVPALLPSPMHLDAHPADDLHPPDSPTTELITSLRSQLALLSEQAHQLNTKLVASITQNADLEDAHFHLQEEHTSLAQRADGLEGEKRRWEESMKSGMLVERQSVRDEMQRLVEGLVEEEKRRGSAEERREKVEGEIDELAASLFDQANTMVAAERMGRIQAEERLRSTEENLAAAEAAMRDMQQHLQTLQTTRSPPPVLPAARRSSSHHAASSSIVAPRRYLSSHVPYSEFLVFLQHLRALRPIRESHKHLFPPPLVTNLLAQPFLARAVLEDHDPTLRLDAAPDLSWLSRRSVGQAIIAGELIIEPVSAGTVLAANTNSMYDIGCAMCGKPVFPPPPPSSNPHGSNSPNQFGPPPSHPTHRGSSGQSRFSLKPFFNTSSPGPAVQSSPTQSPLASPAPHGEKQPRMESVYIFRVARSTSTTGGDKSGGDSRSYPLCKTGWCLERLRATCELWHFIRTGIVHVVWNGDDGHALRSSEAKDEPRESSQPAAPLPLPEKRGSVDGVVGGAGGPPAMPRQKSGWGLGFKLPGIKTARSVSPSSADMAPSSSSPVSPGVEKKEAKGVDEEVGEGEGDSKLGEPLRLRGGMASPEARVPDIHEPRSSGESGREGARGKAAGEEEGEGSGLAAPPRLRRGDSTPSIGGTSEGEEGFATPTGEEHAALPAEAEAGEEDEDEDAANLRAALEEEDEENLAAALQAEDEGQAPPAEQSSKTEREVQGDALAAEVGHENGAEEQTKEEAEADTPRDVTATPVPPPVPRRAEARQRMSQVPTPTETASPKERELPTDLSAAIASSTKLSAAADPASSPPRHEAEPELQPVELASPRPPPPLPPRHPRTPQPAPSSPSPATVEQPAEGVKRFLADDGEGWEERTWRQVVRIKEGMWLARVGVVDA